MVCIGFEDNICVMKDCLVVSNVELVEYVVFVVERYGYCVVIIEEVCIFFGCCFVVIV